MHITKTQNKRKNQCMVQSTHPKYACQQTEAENF
jgi:hypothetical protein